MSDAEHVTRAALAAADDPTATPEERAEMLMELAMSLQVRPRQADDLHAALALYARGLDLCPPGATLLRARLEARRGTALQALPGDDAEPLAQALAAYERAQPVLAADGTPEELAELHMNRGLVLQALANAGRASLRDAIGAYHLALRTFDAARHPAEYAIVQNNLATALLALPESDGRAKVREAIAVQCFEQGLKAVSRERFPLEYAMLQNNLGNALQYASSSHAFENNLRALAAYDEALTVRREDTAPIEYANTLANKANCLRSLGRRELAAECYAQARAVFARHGEPARARLVAEALHELEAA